MRIFVTYAQDDWKGLLPIIAMVINNRNASSTGLSPFFFTHGYHIDPLGIDDGNITPADKITPPIVAGESFVKRLREATDWAQSAIAVA